MKGFLIFLITATLLHCAKNPIGPKPPEPKYELIYYCSFESSEDTTGWKGITSEMFVNDPAPGCGNKALRIGGGCKQPVALIVLDSQTKTGRYRLSCWGKKGEGGGGVKLAVVQNHEYLIQIVVGINSPEWKFYQNEGVFTDSTDCQLRLELWVGGIIPQSVFIDGLKVERSQ